MKRSDWNVLICVLGSAMLVSCGAPGVPIPPALELAKPVTDLRAARKGDRVYLAWTVPIRTTDRQTLRHLGATSICRSLKVPVTECKNPVAEIPAARFPLPGSAPAKPGSPAPKVEASYTDILPEELQKQDPTAEISYAVSVQNESGRSAGLSNRVQVPSAPALPPPNNFHAEVTSSGVLLSWDCPPAPPASDVITHKLRIYRREQGKPGDAKVSDVDYGSCPQIQPANPGAGAQTNRQAELLDQAFEWENHYVYRAAVITVVAEPSKPGVEVEGDDTPVVSIFAHDVFPPPVPTGLQAVFSGVGQAPFIDLVWSPDTEADLAGYNVFRHEEGGQPVKLNPELVKTPAFRDLNVQSGKKYFYSVSAVDERNNASAKSEEASERVP
ncbi:MAG: fibronectin type III domain-containing protein [Terriglobales bacterium]